MTRRTGLLPFSVQALSLARCLIADGLPLADGLPRFRYLFVTKRRRHCAQPISGDHRDPSPNGVGLATGMTFTLRTRDHTSVEEGRPAGDKLRSVERPRAFCCRSSALSGNMWFLSHLDRTNQTRRPC